MGIVKRTLRPIPLDNKLPFLLAAVNASILLGWVLLYRPVFAYFWIIFTREEFRTSQWVLLGILILLGLRLRNSAARPVLSAAPRLQFPALALTIGASAAFLLVERFLNINTLSAALFGLATYGLAGLWLRERAWRQGFLVALLLIAVLPFGDHLDTFVGYPVRILTATLVQHGFAAAGFPSIGVDSILVFENGVSQVDLPCSGVKSLWTGMLFLLAATWIERRSLSLRWLFTALVFAVLLLAANLLRVALLVAAGPVAGWNTLAEMLHVPLGVIGFVAACAGAVYMLRRQPLNQTLDSETIEPDSPPSPRPLWLGPLVAFAMLGMALLYAPRPALYPVQSSAPVWSFPPEMHITPLPLTPQEVEWITSGGADAVERVRFRWNELEGSMILISSQTWRGQHRPERCFEVYGLSVDRAETQLIGPAFPVRSLLLGYAGEKEQLSAAYWFQSPTRITDDYATRIWADLPPHREQWVLITILFDNLQAPRAADLQAFYTAIQASAARNLNGGMP